MSNFCQTTEAEAVAGMLDRIAAKERLSPTRPTWSIYYKERGFLFHVWITQWGNRFASNIIYGMERIGGMELLGRLAERPAIAKMLAEPIE